MTRRQKDPLRPLTQGERELLVRIGRSHAERASHVARAKALLAVADGKSYTAAAKAGGRRSGDAVSDLVSRFNREGMAAIEPRHMGAVQGSPTPPESASASSKRRVGPPIARRTGVQPGRFLRYAGLCVRLTTGCPRFPPTPSGRS
jgi:hypothetical protein